MPKVYSVWYSNKKDGSCLYANNIAKLETAKQDLKDILTKPGVSKAWIKLYEESTVEEAFPVVDPMQNIADMDEREAKEALFQLQVLVKAILNVLPKRLIPNNAIASIPAVINDFVCESADHIIVVDQLEEDVGILNKEIALLEQREARLRKVLSKIAENLGNGSAISQEASFEFIEQIPDEIKLVIKRLSSAIQKAEKESEHFKKIITDLKDAAK
jgi:hypothetical protein